jgi:nucleotide-binding universal stress UspA family protein
MKKIIAAVDFSPASKNAAYYAADLAVQINADLLLVNVVEIPVGIGEMPGTAYVLDNMIADSEKELQTLSAELAEHANNKIKITSSTSMGPVTHALHELAKKENAFCIVIGTDSMTAAEHLLVKNHALAAAHSVTTPVLIVPPQTSFKGIRTVVLASDLRGYENIITLQILKNWLRSFKVKLDVLNVVQGGQAVPENVTGSRTLLNELFEFNPEYHFIDNNKVNQGVEDYVDRNHSDLLVTMPGRRSFFNGLFHKSDSKQLIREPHVPVLSIYK